MATTTPNFGWPVPTSSDLVKNGATAIEGLGDAIDASLLDLKGGTTGQVLAKTSATDMDFTWTTASSGSTNMAGKNGALNSNFSVWQRGTSFATSNTQYTADRWMSYISPSGSPVFTYSRQLTNDTTNLPFIQYCMRIQRTSGQTFTSQMFLAQDFETVNSIPYAGKAVTMSFYARKGANYSAASDALSYSVITGTGTDQNNFTAGYTGAATPLSGTATLTTTWQRFSTTVTLASTATELELRFNWTPSGTAGAADYAEITGVQLEIASSASAYSPNTSTQQAELAACQRYYYLSTSGVSGAIVAGGFAYDASTIIAPNTLPTTMRTTPTLVATTGTNYYKVQGGGYINNFNTLSLWGGTSTNVAFQNGSGTSLATQGHGLMILTNSTSSSVALSAEL